MRRIFAPLCSIHCMGMGILYMIGTDDADALKEGWKPLDYSGLGLFVFEHRQYLSALDVVTQEWHQQKL